MTTLLVVMLWGSLTLMFYTFVGYPLIVHAIARWQCRSDDLSSLESVEGVSIHGDETLPNVLVLIAAHNAEPHVAQRICNLLSCDYPEDRLRVLVASDGSSDGTADAVRQYEDGRVDVLDFQERRGKAMTLMRAIDQLPDAFSDHVLVFTDVTTKFASDALRRLGRHFADPSIGLVSGHVQITDQSGMPAESLYWKCEMSLRRCEAALGILSGASGAIYAVRRSLFVHTRMPVVNDDLLFPMLVGLVHGVGVRWDQQARAFASTGDGWRAEFSRRRRIGSGAWQCIRVLGQHGHWWRVKQTWAFVSHKLLRWTSGVWMLTALVSAAVLSAESLYLVIWVMQIALYAMAAAGLVAKSDHVGHRLMRLATSFTLMNVALLCGVIQGMVRPNNAVWQPTKRRSATTQGLNTQPNRLVPPPRMSNGATSTQIQATVGSSVES